jgi:RHS repeat-associated protein
LGGIRRHDFAPFGEELSAGIGIRSAALGYGDDAIRQKFGSKERDIETGLDYFGARYFASAQGRFTSPDEIFADQSEGDPQSWNLYAYVRNNPLRYIDPLGLAHVDANGNWVGDEDGEYDKQTGLYWNAKNQSWENRKNDASQISVTGGSDTIPMVIGLVGRAPIPPQAKALTIAFVIATLYVQPVEFGPTKYFHDPLCRLTNTCSQQQEIHAYIPPPKELKAFPNAKKVRSKSQRARWADDDYIYEWDSQHGRVEKYNKRGKHLGEFDPDTGEQTKPPDPGRSIEP